MQGGGGNGDRGQGDKGSKLIQPLVCLAVMS